jgi:hypothetical protein
MGLHTAEGFQRTGTRRISSWPGEINLHKQAGYIDADFLSLNFSLAFTRRTIHLGNYHPLQSEVAENQRHFGKDEQPGRIDDPLRYVA